MTAAAEAHAPLVRYLELRDSLRRTRIGDGGVDTCRALSAVLDEAIESLFPPTLAGELAVVATGGYGRREQSLYSDVDVMLLHSGIDLNGTAKILLYPLWDAGLKVGHSVRTVAEAVAAAKADLETLTSLLSARLIVGSDRLVSELEDSLGRLLKGRPITSQLIAGERHRRTIEVYPLLAADLKNGRGGLRTLQSFEWERRRAELVSAPAPHHESAEEAAARGSLLAVRNALHAAAGKATDRFVPDLREVAATWLGTDLWDVSERVTTSNRAVDRLAMQRWPDLAADRAEISVAGMLRNRFRRAPRNPEPPNRPLARIVFAIGRPEGVVLTPQDQKAIGAAGAQDWTPADRADFLAMLERGPRGRVAFGWLDTLGWVDANLPEIAHTIAAPQLAPFHEHPVDTHLWRTVDEMRSLIDESGTTYSSIATEIDNRELLLLAAFLHDIGKALPGDHSTVGADLARSLCTRIGFTELAAPIATLVGHHLLLAETAAKRDTGDPRVLQEVADICGDPATLQALYLLTVADARATGRTMWSHWKATLLRNLYVRLAALLDPRPGLEGRAQRIKSVSELSASAVDQVAAHIDAMPEDYLAAHSDDEIVSHALLARNGTTGASVEILDAGEPAPRVVVVAADEPGLLGAITGVLAIHNLEVLDARLQTRSDGVACDTFHVRQLLHDVAMPRPDQIAEELAEALSGSIDLAGRVAAKTAPYRSAPANRLVVRTPTDPTLRYTAIEVRCNDRPGVLFEIVQELYAAGLDIRMARIDTRGDEVRDLFYVLRAGEPIRDVNQIAPLIAGLRRALRRRLGISAP